MAVMLANTGTILTGGFSTGPQFARMHFWQLELKTIYEYLVIFFRFMFLDNSVHPVCHLSMKL